MNLIERENGQPIKKERENIHCVPVSGVFTDFLFNLRVGLHPEFELDVLIVDLQRF